LLQSSQKMVNSCIGLSGALSAVLLYARNCF
jgi:hypothetical protein